MRLLLNILIVSALLCSQGCLFETSLKNKIIKAIEQPFISTKSEKTIQDNNPESQFLSRELLPLIYQYRIEILLILVLLLLLIRYQRRKRKKNISLDESDIALIGVASDALKDLQYRLKKKTKAQVLPLPEKDKTEKKFDGNDSSVIHS